MLLDRLVSYDATYVASWLSKPLIWWCTFKILWVHLLDILGTCTPIPFCIVTNICHKVTELTWHHNITLCTARNNLFEELFRGITLDDVFDDVTLTKTE